MPAPRPACPDKYYFITRRCTQRTFLLRPDEETNNAFLYCLIEAALRFEIDLMMMCAMSNHYHSVIRDRFGRFPEFIEHFHKMLARSQNALRGRWENMWAPGPTSVVELTTLDAVIEKIVYTATNPVNDLLVERVHHWPGVNGLKNLVSGDTLHASRPRHFFRTEGPMPEEVEIALTIPAELGDRAEIVTEIVRRVQVVEGTVRAERLRTGQRIIGRSAILEQSWKMSPTTWAPRRRLRPRVAGRDVEERVKALQRYAVFELSYAKARTAWLAGEPAVFPHGTYWLRRFANVAVAEA